MNFSLVGIIALAQRVKVNEDFTVRTVFYFKEVKYSKITLNNSFFILQMAAKQHI